MGCCEPHSNTPGNARTLTRRDLLSLLARGAGTAALTPSLLQLLCDQALAQAAVGTPATRHLILLWLQGGPSQLETFDPKPGQPNQGPFKALPTDVKGLLFGEYLPRLATRAQHLGVVRTMTTKEGSHSRALQLVHTGYIPNPAVSFPTLGSIVGHELGSPDFDLPSFIQIDGPPGSAGYLGLESAPFVIEDPEKRIENLSYFFGVNPQALDQREKVRAILDAEFKRRGGRQAVEESEASRRRARRMMDTKLLSAFDLDREPEALRDSYGRNKFGQGVLLARRLAEHGVSAIEVVLDGWDTHVDNFNRTRDLCKLLDPAFSTLVDDLIEHDLFDRTLVVCMGEFGRTPNIQPADGRNHWPGNFCVALAGCGIQGGSVVGETDEQGKTIATRPVQIGDLFATFAKLLGVDGTKEFSTNRRPVTLIEPTGVVVKELLA